MKTKMPGFLAQLLTERSLEFEQRIDAAKHQGGYGHISRPLIQFTIMMTADPIRVGDVARALGTSRQWAIRLANEGKSLGIFNLEVDPNDRRAALVSLTPAGWDMVDAARSLMREISEEIAARIGDDNFDDLMRILAMPWWPDEHRSRTIAPHMVKRTTERARSQ